MTRAEMHALGWDELDILLVTGDAYVDHPSFGCAVIGRSLIDQGWRVGVIAQPNWKTADSLTGMGRPRIAVGVTAGNLDSMLSIYTASRRFRDQDAYAPGGKTGFRPPHATVVYTQLAKSAFPKIPVVLGGIEASLRRLVHYDHWQDKIQPSFLSTSKADILAYGMAERAAIEIFHRLERGASLEGIPGTARLLGKKAAEAFSIDEAHVLRLPSYQEIVEKPSLLLPATVKSEREMNPWQGRLLVQSHGDRLLVVEKPDIPLESDDLDRVYALPYSRKPHPVYKEPIPAFTMIKDSITAVRGCPGGCTFCGIHAHQGKLIVSRSKESVVEEVKRVAASPDFKGTISDIGGPTANTFGSYVEDIKECEKCTRASCWYPKVCPNFKAPQEPGQAVLSEARAVSRVKHVFVSSGIRFDLAKDQPELMRDIIKHHVSGHLKVAPEHMDPFVLRLMRKCSADDFHDFARFFREESEKAGKQQYLVPYFISNFPGCSDKEAESVEQFLKDNKWKLQQVQDYIPLPMTLAAAMYVAETTPAGRKIPVNKGLAERRPQATALKNKGIQARSKTR